MSDLKIGPWQVNRRTLVYRGVEGLEIKTSDGYRGELVSHTGSTETKRYSYEVRAWFLARAREILGEEPEPTPDAYALRLEHTREARSE